MPSVNSTAKSARSAVILTMSLPGVMWTMPRKPSLTSAPPAKNSSEVESTDRAASPDSNTATSSAAPKTMTSTT